VICVVSDHGFFRVEKELRLNSAFREEGLLELNEKGKVGSWKAFAWSSSGSAAVLVSNPNDTALVDKTRSVLRNLCEDPSHGIHRVLEKEDIASLGGFPNAAFLVGMREDFKISEEASGPRLQSFNASGSHGFLPEQAGMNSVFFISGPGIPSGQPLGLIDMRDIAPTVARVLSITLPQAEGRALFGDE
jgi:predicted AlkP superfamily pyrophosphatase or phosphodiesterase